MAPDPQPEHPDPVDGADDAPSDTPPPAPDAEEEAAKLGDFA